MQYRALGQSGLQVSALIFGCWQIGHAGEYGLTDADSIAAIRRALDLGINSFDTAGSYGDGESERLLARALQGVPRHEVVLCTKAEPCRFADGSSRSSGDPAHLRAAIDHALERLQTDYVDLFQIHWPDPDVSLGESWAAMVDIWQAGKARAIGVSNYFSDQIEACTVAGPVHSLQPEYSLLEREAERDGTLAYCQATGIGVIAYSPLGRGLLTGKHDPAVPPVLPPGDYRAQMPHFQPGAYGRVAAFARRLGDLAAGSGHSAAELALAWVLHQPALSAAIVGARTPSQIAAHIPAVDWRLSPADLAAVAVLARAVSPERF